ncbi:ABC transporter permease [Pseudomonas sp. NFR16]|uniref:ABC transporter permease n=1 Tax=Pseudomonas sp. NFR16 TaxID=1566248 RepID=UPI0008CE8E7B|nr:ABC transporter permease [Pseudomonas sp. NFR16]SEI48691.1 peptide/nickel transport system permease protein [Pseudomonas sp. NFR16]
MTLPSSTLAAAADAVLDSRVAARHFNRPPLAITVSCLFLLVLAVVLALPFWITHYDPLAGDVSVGLQAPSTTHWFGTDRLGRDVFARVVYGARYSLLIGLSGMLISLVIGTLLGLVAGMKNRWLDEVASRLFDVLSAFPSVLLALLVIALIGPGLMNVAVAIGIAGIPKFGRLVRSQTLLVREADYVRHAVLYGRSRLQTFVTHLLPNVLMAIPIVATIDIGSSIMAVSGLSFLGLGPQPPTPEWGVMLAEGRDVLRVAWWPSVFPGLAITLTVISFTVLGSYCQRRFEGRQPA